MKEVRLTNEDWLLWPFPTDFVDVARSDVIRYVWGGTTAKARFILIGNSCRAQ